MTTTAISNEQESHDDHICTILHHRQALKEPMSDSEKELLWNELIGALEVLLKKGPAAYEAEVGKEDELLQEISHATEELVKLNPSCEDRLLDWAIASKRAGNMDDCVVAHKMRMEICPHYKITDAVRLLGLSSIGTSIECFPTKGLFEQCQDTNEHVYRPSVRACEYGCRIRSIFESHDYTLSNCRVILAPFIVSNVSSDRIFSANSFFHHRHDLNGDFVVTGLNVLARLFLFGLALSREVVQQALGEECIKCLGEAGLLSRSQVHEEHVVAEVQVYPICSRDLFVQDMDSIQCWFMTDWPMESLRSTKDAVMPVGYDTLELMSLSAALEPAKVSQRRLLDLCCGCGIQGIFALVCNPDDFYELVCSDISRRACCFASANMALNMRDGDTKSYAVKGDLYENITGKFGCILSNPPFVAIPSYGTTLNTALPLYTQGGGVDGTVILKRAVKVCFDYVDGDEAMMLIVSELPNIESSCTLLQSFLPKHNQACIRVAYVGRDVESVAQYTIARQAESTSYSAAEGQSAQVETGIYNRALALISISSIGKSNKIALHQYGDERVDDSTCYSNDADTIDEEDAFLTRDGVRFTRAHIL